MKFDKNFQWHQVLFINCHLCDPVISSTHICRPACWLLMVFTGYRRWTASWSSRMERSPNSAHMMLSCLTMVPSPSSSRPISHRRMTIQKVGFFVKNNCKFQEKNGCLLQWIFSPLISNRIVCCLLVEAEKVKSEILARIDSIVDDNETPDFVKEQIASDSGSEGRSSTTSPTRRTISQEHVW